MVVNKYFLREMYLNDFVQQIDYLARSLSEKVLPAFNDIEEEAHNTQREAYERLSKISDPEWVDPAKIADTAYHAGVNFYIMAQGIVQGIKNMFCAGLYHLFEQQLLKFHRRELLYRPEEDNIKLMTVEEARNRLFEGYGIDITTFSSWGKIVELKLVANCTKHADGPSCEKLKERRTDLFTPPSMRDDTGKWPLSFVGQVFQPLAGEDLYIGLDEFREYVAAVGAFWHEFGEAFDRFEYKS